MSISKEFGEATIRFKSYIDRLIQLFKKHDIKNPKGIIEAVRHNQEFSAEWRAIWNEIAREDGGKISLTTIGAIIGAVFGGVGIAAGGGAIGLPLAAVLGLGGLITGIEFDSLGVFSEKKHLLLRLPKPLYNSIVQAAEVSEISPKELIVNTLHKEFSDNQFFKTED